MSSLKVKPWRPAGVLWMFLANGEVLGACRAALEALFGRRRLDVAVLDSSREVMALSAEEPAALDILVMLNVDHGLHSCSCWAAWKVFISSVDSWLYRSKPVSRLGLLD